MKEEKNMQKKEKMSEQKYVCPMHSDQTSDKPAKCPVCGMNMVPMEEAQESGM